MEKAAVGQQPARVGIPFVVPGEEELRVPQGRSTGRVPDLKPIWNGIRVLPALYSPERRGPARLIAHRYVICYSPSLQVERRGRFSAPIRRMPATSS